MFTSNREGTKNSSTDNAQLDKGKHKTARDQSLRFTGMTSADFAASIIKSATKKETQKATSTEELKFKHIIFAMAAIDGSNRYLLGQDNWRKPIKDQPYLGLFDHGLAGEVSRQPPSKGGTWDDFSKGGKLWPVTHVRGLLPALHKLLKTYADHGKDSEGGKDKIIISYDLAKEHFSPLSYAIKHCKEYQQLQHEYEYKGKDDVSIKEEWNDRLKQYFVNIGGESSFSEILSSLPVNLREKVNTTLKHGEDPRVENDHLVGRMILAYLPCYKNVPWKTVQMDPKMEDYLKPLPNASSNFEAKSLYERLLEFHVTKIPLLIKSLEEEGVSDFNYKDCLSISMSMLAKTYQWYGTRGVVEMVMPGLDGAALPAALGLLKIFKHVETEREIKYYKDPKIVGGEVIGPFKAANPSLLQAGRLALVQDIIESDRIDKKGKQRGGEPLRKLAQGVWSKDERLKEWGNADLYVPENRISKGDFSTFKQDIGNILYCAGLFEERRGNKTLADSLITIAEQAKGSADNLEALGEVIRKNSDKVNQLADHWQKLYGPDHRRTQVAQLLQQTLYSLNDPKSRKREDSGYPESNPKSPKRAKLDQSGMSSNL